MILTRALPRDLSLPASVSALRKPSSLCCQTWHDRPASALKLRICSPSGKCRNSQPVADACRIQRQLREEQKKGRQPRGGDRPQLPADVKACRAQHRVQCIAGAAAEPAAIHPVVALGVADGRLDRLAPLESATLLRIQRPELAAVDNLHRRAGCVDAAKPEVNDRRGGPPADVLQQRVRLLELFGQRVTVIRIGGGRSGLPPSGHAGA